MTSRQTDGGRAVELVSVTTGEGGVVKIARKKGRPSKQLLGTWKLVFP